MKKDICDEATPWLDPTRLKKTIEENATEDTARARAIIEKARERQGLNLDEVAALFSVKDPGLLEEMFVAAKEIKEGIYGSRIVLFAPLYFSNLCKNECLYCAFRAANKEIARRALSQEEIAQQTEILINQGHKRTLIVAGEAYPNKPPYEGDSFQYVLDTIATVYSVKNGNGEMRRVNANLAPMSVENFARIQKAGVGTYQCFQETYDREVYARVHVRGTKSNFDWRCSTMDRAIVGGMDDLGMGVLFGLADWRFDVLGLLSHVRHLEERFNIGCHTISVPRLEPAKGSDVAAHPPHQVSDDDFKKIIAILRLAVPYTGMIMSTREMPEMRRQTLELGVSQISAGSKTDPGGYGPEGGKATPQFEVGDHRPLDEVIKELAEQGFIPSFCTACEVHGRMGEAFMKIARPGLIKKTCTPNALTTFQEYLQDYASPETRRVGEAAIEKKVKAMRPEEKRLAESMLRRTRLGHRGLSV